MRIPGSKVYRAFPELDRFGDAQCGRFMKAVKRDWWVARIARVGLSLAVFLAVGGAGYLAAYKVLTSLTRSANDAFATTRGTVLLILGATVPLLLALLAALVVRDIVLRRRLRTVINERARCLGCGYSLLGVPVGDDLVVRCPECGAPTEVDPALAELQQQEGGGGKVFRPSAHNLTLTPKEQRRRKRTAGAMITVLALVVLSPVAIWGFNEWRIARSAAQAAAEKPGIKAIAALAATLPQTGDSSIDAWAEFENVRVLINQADAAGWLKGEMGGENDSSGKPLPPEFGYVGREVVYGNEQERETTRRQSTVAERMLPAYTKAGVFDAMRTMRAGRIGLPFSLAPSQPLMMVMVPQLGQARQLARINTDRAALARRADDPAAFEDAMLSSLALARMCDRVPFLIGRLVGAAITAQVHEELFRLMASHPDKQWLDVADRLIALPFVDTPATYHLEGDRLGCIDAAAVYFSDTDTVRRRQRLALTSWSSYGRTSVRIGTFAEARDTFNSAFELAKSEATKERFQRSPALAETVSDMEVVAQHLPSLTNVVNSLDLVDVDRRGLRVMAALERFRLEKGAYPARLDELVPGFIAALPTDPFSGKDYLYRPVAAVTGAQAPGFILYIRGRDGVDDGGVPGAFYLDALQGGMITKVDYVINGERK